MTWRLWRDEGVFVAEVGGLHACWTPGGAVAIFDTASGSWVSHVESALDEVQANEHVTALAVSLEVRP